MNATAATESRDRRDHTRRGPFRWMMDAVYSTLRWIGRHSRGFYTAVGTFLIFGLLLAGVTLGLFALLANVVASGIVQSLDESIVLGTRELENPIFDGLAILGAVLGSGTAAWIVILAGSFFLWRSRHHYSVYLLWVSLGGARLLNLPLKNWFERPRPGFFREDLDLLGRTFTFPQSYSFPSGHAFTSTVVFFTLAYLIARLERTRGMRRDTLLAATAIVILVALSRIYLGVHYPSDVIAGVLAGFLWASVAALAIEAVRYFRERKPEVATREKDLEIGIRPIQEALGA
jgi:undecaprenyl-diphosphatase